MKSARSKFSTLQQICAYIPGHPVAKLARKYGVDEQGRGFSPWSHIVALLDAELSHAIGLNNVYDGIVGDPRRNAGRAQHAVARQ
jgi:hypothetical protein